MKVPESNRMADLSNGRPTAFLDLMILARTYGLLYAGVIVGVSRFEARYITNVHPLAMLVALAAMSRPVS
jgi:hypothetical protein